MSFSLAASNTPGAPSFAFFAKGGIGKSLCRHLLIPPFAKGAKDGARRNEVNLPIRKQMTGNSLQ
jgi:hypothetical protein